MQTSSLLSSNRSGTNKKNTARIIISECCLMQSIDETQMRSADIGEELVVSIENAANACGAGRALYLDVADDKSKGQMTATKASIEMIGVNRRMYLERQAKREKAAQTNQESTNQMAEAFAQAIVAALLTHGGVKGPAQGAQG